MTIAQIIDEDRHIRDTDGDVGETIVHPGGDERRMHVRAYNHWVSLLDGRGCPSIADLDPAGIADFGANSVLIDFSRGIDDPAIAFLGRALRDECGLAGSIGRIADVPARSLLSRLTDHCLQIIANRAPIGFEAEFIAGRGCTTLYRGILMPFSSDGATIDFVYGVINWKDVVEASFQAALCAELEASLRDRRPQASGAAIWADGPGAAATEHGADTRATATLADHLALARESAAAMRTVDMRSRAALYRALGRAHDLALAAKTYPQGFRGLLEEAGIAHPRSTPLAALVKLVFGADYDKTRRAEFMAVLAFAADNGIAAGTLADRLGEEPGGIKALVAAHRRTARRRPDAPAPRPLAERASLARLTLETGAAPGRPVILFARAGEDGTLDVIGSLCEEKIADRVWRALP